MSHADAQAIALALDHIAIALGRMAVILVAGMIGFGVVIGAYIGAYIAKR